MKSMKKLILTIMTILPLASFGFSIDCQTPRLAQEFSISPAQITFYKEEAPATPQRSVASLKLVRTRKTEKGFTKTFALDGHQFSIHIENTNKFSDIEDYITIKNAKGHEVIYPLSCKHALGPK